jgi:RNA polymerase sigma-70 factor (ECF subfamily)
MGNDRSTAVPTVAQPPTPALRWLEEHGDALYRFALQRVRRPEIAEDIVQETLLAAISAKEKFSGQSNPRTWLIGILKHKLVDHLRKSFRERECTAVEISAANDYFDKHGHWKAKSRAWNKDPRLEIENAEFRAVLESCLSKLPPRIAQLFWLREADGMDTQWLCKELRISPTNLWTMLHRARLGLRRCLSIHWFDDKAD